MGEGQTAAAAALAAFAIEAKEASERIGNDCTQSEAKLTEINKLDDALKSVSLTTLSTALQAHLDKLSELKDSFGDAKTSLLDADTYFHTLIASAEKLKPAECCLIDQEHAAITSIAAFYGFIKATPNTLSTAANAAWNNLTPPLQTLASSAAETSRRADEATDARGIHAGTLAANALSLRDAVRQAAAGRIAEHWGGLIAAAGMELQQTEATGNFAFNQSRQRTRVSVISGATQALTSISERAAQLDAVLTQMNDLAEKARQLQIALKIASGGL